MHEVLKVAADKSYSLTNRRRRFVMQNEARHPGLNDEVRARITASQFGRQLQQLLHERGWSQADLVRRVRETTGQKMGRDAVSTYVNGRSFPSPKSLNLLSKAFGINQDELLRNRDVETGSEPEPKLELRMAPGRPGKAWLRIDRLVTFETAAEIVKMINAEDVAASK